MQGIFQKENTDKALKYGIYRHLPTYEKIIRNLVSFSPKKTYFLSKITTFILLAGTTTVFAAGKQLMSYNGTGIMAKASVSNFTLSEETTITIDHNQSLNPAYAKYTDARLDVNLQKKELLNIAIPEIQKPAKAVLD